VIVHACDGRVGAPLYALPHGAFARGINKLKDGTDGRCRSASALLDVVVGDAAVRQCQVGQEVVPDTV
jgi:hypothetical protein